MSHIYLMVTSHIFSYRLRHNALETGVILHGEKLRGGFYQGKVVAQKVGLAAWDPMF